MGTFFGLIFGVWLIGTFICWPVFWARKTDRSQAPIVRRGIGLAHALVWPIAVVRHFMGQQQRQAAKAQQRAAEHRILAGQPPASGQHGSPPSNRAGL